MNEAQSITIRRGAEPSEVWDWDSEVGLTKQSRVALGEAKRLGWSIDAVLKTNDVLGGQIRVSVRRPGGSDEDRPSFDLEWLRGPQERNWRKHRIELRLPVGHGAVTIPTFAEFTRYWLFQYQPARCDGRDTVRDAEFDV